MDLFFSGLAQRASEQTWDERRSQFSKVHETAIQEIEMERGIRFETNLIQLMVPESSIHLQFL